MKVIEVKVTTETEFKQTVTTKASATSHIVTGLSENTDYEFIVKAQNKAGYSEASVSATMKTLPKVGMYCHPSFTSVYLYSSVQLLYVKVTVF